MEYTTGPSACPVVTAVSCSWRSMTLWLISRRRCRGCRLAWPACHRNGSRDLLPHQCKTHRPVEVLCPLWLLRQPLLINQSLLHFQQGPAGAFRCLEMIAKQVDITLNRNGCATLTVEVGGNASHQEIGMIPYEHKASCRLGNPCDFTVERKQVGEMLVCQHHCGQRIALRCHGHVQNIPQK